LPANLGISVHPEYEYAAVEADGKTLIMAEGLIAEAAEVIGWTDYRKTASWKGAELEYVVCQHPFYERDSLVILGEHVTLDSGTGCVHTAPGHGAEDFQVGQKYELGVLCPVDDQ